MQRLRKDPAMLRETDGLDLVSRRFIEESIDLWEEALDAELPVPEPSETGTTIPLSDVLTAPRAGAKDVQPSEVYHYDGLIPLTKEDLRQSLDALTRQVTRASVEIRFTNITPGTKVAAARAYVFREPVHEARGVSGELTLPGGTVWQPGSPATILVEIIEAQEAQHAERAYETLVCDIEGGHLARWTKA